MLTTGIERLEGMANHKSRKDGSILRGEIKKKSNSCLKSIQTTRKNALTFDINSSSEKRHPVQAILNIQVLTSKALYQFFNQFQTLIEFTRVTLAWSVVICVQDKSLKKKKSLPVERRKLSESSLYRVKDLVMSIGDRVTEKRQDHYINVCITNEDFTFILCFEKVSQPQTPIQDEGWQTQAKDNEWLYMVQKQKSNPKFFLI